MLTVLLLLSGLVALSDGASVTRQRQCPMVKCAAPPCASPLPTYYFYPPAGKLCQSCDHCPGGGKKRLAVGWSLPFNMCPIPMCAYPGFCSVPLVTSYFTFQGKRCPGCPSCPAGNGEFSLSGPMAVAAD